MSRGGRMMGLDVGERRIGVAVSDEMGLIASPARTIRRGGSDVAELLGLARELGVDRVVVGLPTGLSGREGPQAVAVRAFAEHLASALGPAMTVEFWDERLSTVIAERALVAAGTRRARRREQVDAVAAAVILQGYLDAQAARRARDGRRG